MSAINTHIQLVLQPLLVLELRVTVHDLVLPLEIQPRGFLLLVRHLQEQMLVVAHFVMLAVRHLIVVVVAGLFLLLNAVLPLEIQLGEFLL